MPVFLFFLAANINPVDLLHSNVQFFYVLLYAVSILTSDLFGILFLVVTCFSPSNLGLRNQRERQSLINDLCFLFPFLFRKF